MSNLQVRNPNLQKRFWERFSYTLSFETQELKENVTGNQKRQGLIPDAESTLGLLTHREIPESTVVLGDSVATEESDNTVEASAPFARIGIAAALLELLFPI
nr:hypothetical protein Iba_chr11dCG2810 [Ipomoea batatas]